MKKKEMLDWLNKFPWLYALRLDGWSSKMLVIDHETVEGNIFYNMPMKSNTEILLHYAPDKDYDGGAMRHIEFSKYGDLGQTIYAASLAGHIPDFIAVSEPAREFKRHVTVFEPSATGVGFVAVTKGL